MKKTILLLLAFVFVACSTKQGVQREVSKLALFPKLYEKEYKSILVVPAINSTKSLNASLEFSYTVGMPLSQMGYYVFPMQLVQSYILANKLGQNGELRLRDLKQLKARFNPDAIMFIDIDHWSSSYKVIKSSAAVGAVYNLIDANTGKQLWQNSGIYYRVAGGAISTSAGLIGLALGTIIATAGELGQDSQEYAQMAYTLNSYAFYDLPMGPYQSSFHKDGKSLIKYYDEGDLRADRLYVKSYFVEGSAVMSGSKDKLCTAGADSIGVCTGLAGFEHYYRQKQIGGKSYFLNSFFKYQNAQPYLYADNKKVFVKTLENGKIPYYLSIEHEKSKYFNIEKKLYYFKVLRVENLK